MADISIKTYRGKRYIGGASPIVPAYIQGDAPPPNNPPGSTGGGKRDITALTEMLSTGLNEGGVLSINGGDASKFDISAGNGIIVDHSTSPPTFIEVSWNTFTAQTLTNLATSFATDIAINSLGQIVQQNSYTNEEVRGLIFLGGIDHNNQVTISDTFSITAPTKAVGSNVRELARAIGDINLTGNNYFANGSNLNINKSDGLVFSYGRNFLTNVDNPNTITTASETIITFGYVFNDGSGNGVFTADTTTINPNNYDDGSGTLATVANNKFTIQRILLFANVNKTFIQYGTEEYLKLDDALNAVPRATFVALNGIRTALIRGYLIVEKGETDLTNATFLSANRFGIVASNTVGAGNYVTLDTAQTITGAKTFNNEVLEINGLNPVLRIKNTSNNSILNFRNVANEDEGGLELIGADGKLKLVTRLNNTDIQIEPHGTGSIILPNVASGTPVSSLGIDANNKVVSSSVTNKLYVVPNVALIGLNPNVTTLGSYSYNYSITSSGIASVDLLPVGTLIEFEFGMEVNCTVANGGGGMDLIISLKFGDFLLSIPISSLALSTSTTKTLHTTNASFIIRDSTDFSAQIVQKAYRSSSPSYDRDQTNVSINTIGAGSNITVGLLFGQTDTDNYLKINHGFLKIVLP